MADGRPRLGGGEEGLHIARTGVGEEELLLGALREQAAVGPGGIGVQERANLGGRAISATECEPVDELAAGGLGEAVAQAAGLGESAAGGSRDRLAQALGVLGRDGDVADRRDGRIEERDVLGLLGERGRLGQLGHGRAPDLEVDLEFGLEAGSAAGRAAVFAAAGAAAGLGLAFGVSFASLALASAGFFLAALGGAAFGSSCAAVRPERPIDRAAAPAIRQAARTRVWRFETARITSNLVVAVCFWRFTRS